MLCAVGSGEGDNGRGRGGGGYVSELIKSKHASENFWMENPNQQGDGSEGECNQQFGPGRLWLGVIAI